MTVRHGAATYGLAGVWTAAVLALCAAGCSHYSTTGRLPSHIRTISIPTFENQTPEFSLPQGITDLVTERFLSEANLRLAEADQADAALNGTVRRYYEEAESYRQTQDIQVTGRRVTIVLDVEFIDRVENKTLWRDSNFSRYVVYDPDKETEQQAAQRVMLLLADDLVSAVLQQW
ncbi:LPS assembly lipoprotein LptE [bacterium]|nr:LPS assembly lipoprotein LptE [bacterium]